ncbi:MAG: hypothetical protein FJ368_02485 [Pelagibacterales bacterium]|nr:hypothetical protein [Pelagibacterales bacterium]
MIDNLVSNKVRNNFLRDREAVLSSVKTYLSSEKHEITSVDDCRELAKKNIAEGNLVAAMQNLEIARDAKRGISSFVYSNENNSSPIFFRDARRCLKNKKVFEEGIEATEIIVICAFEAAKDVLELSNISYSQEEMKKMAVDFFDNFERQNANKSQKQLIKEVDYQLNRIISFLQESGVKNASKHLTKALHFQNFKQEQNCNPVTISEIADDDRTKHLVIDANVAFKEITEEQKELYNKIAKSSSVPLLQRKLMNKYRDQFFSGNYIIPTQLIDLVPGIRNGFEEITLFSENCDQVTKTNPVHLEIIDVRKRCGALPSLLKDEKLAHEVSQSNLRQLDSLIGDRNGKKIHWNSLNTASPTSLLQVKIDDFRIVERTKNAVDGNNHKLSVTPFNAFRSIPNAGDFKGIRSYLKELVSSISTDIKEGKDLKRGFKTGGIFSSLFSSNSSFDKTLASIEDEDCRQIISLAKDLQQDLKKLSRKFIFGLDKENIRLSISNKFNALSKAVNSAIETENSTFLKIFDIQKVPYEEVVVFCKSGKDRTGLSMFCQEIHKIQNKVKISFQKAADQLHLSGHIEALPGSIRIGGGTPGCYQLLESILPAIPESQKDALQILVGPFAAKNKMPKKSSFFSKLKKMFFSSKDEVEIDSSGFEEFKEKSFLPRKSDNFNDIDNSNSNLEDIEDNCKLSNKNSLSNFTSSQLIQKNKDLAR